MSREEILSKMTELSAMDKEILLSMPPGQFDKFLHNLLEAGKQTSPFVYGPLSVLFGMSPKVARNLLLDYNVRDGNLYLAKFIKSFQEKLIVWLCDHKTLLFELDKCSIRFSAGYENEDFYIDGVNGITEEEEEKYLKVRDNIERHERGKVLAALEMMSMYDIVLNASNSTSEIAAKSSMIYTFLYFCSFAKFTASQSVNDGIGVQAARRNKPRGKNQALIAIKKAYQKNFPGADSRELWREIRKRLSTGNYFEHDGYWVEFKAGNTDIYSGELVQKAEGKRDKSWKFSTFRKR